METDKNRNGNRNEKGNVMSTETKKTDTGIIDVTKKGNGTINTEQFTDYINSRYGTGFSQKNIRHQFRNDDILSEFFDDGERTIYRFESGSDTVHFLVERFGQIIAERTERKNRAEKRKKEKKNRSQKVIRIDPKTGNRTDTVIEIGKKTETEKIEK